MTDAEFDRWIRQNARWRCIVTAVTPWNIASRLSDGWAINRDYSIWSRLRLAFLFLRVDTMPFGGRATKAELLAERDVVVTDEVHVWTEKHHELLDKIRDASGGAS